MHNFIAQHIALVLTVRLNLEAGNGHCALAVIVILATLIVIPPNFGQFVSTAITHHVSAVKIEKMNKANQDCCHFLAHWFVIVHV